MTPYQAHREKWNDCHRCPLCESRRKVVLARGDVYQLDFLFMGEAPGRSEDIDGWPFAGPAGQELDDLIQRAYQQWQVEGTKGAAYNTIRWGFTNLIACIPVDDDGEKISQPDEKDVMSCAPRLQEFVRFSNPKVIVCVGAVARDYLDPSWKKSVRFHRKIPRIEITHPAAILRAKIAQKPSMRTKTIITLRKAAIKLMAGEPVSTETTGLIGEVVVKPGYGYNEADIPY